MTRSRSRLGLSRTEIALFGLVWLLAAPFMHPMGEQQASRYAFSAALWDNGSLSIGDQAHLLGRDKAVVDDVYYSDKAPVQPFLAAPFYGVYRMFGGPAAADTDREGSRWGLWWVTLWSAGIPLAVLAVLMYRWAREYVPGLALPATLAAVFGTMLFAYGTMLFGHVLAGLFGFGAFVLVRRRGASRGRLLAAGALCGLAVLTEFPLALLVLLLTAVAFHLHRGKVVWLVLGGLPFAGLMIVYNTVVFGDPLTFSYQWSAFSTVASEARPLTRMFRGLGVEQILAVLFSQRGLLVESPLVIMAAIGLGALWRANRSDALVVGGALALFTGMMTFWGNPYAGGVGPRYITPVLPLLAAPLAVVWRRWRRPTIVAVGVSVLTMSLAVLTVPQLGSDLDAGLAFWAARAVESDFDPTLFSVAFGGIGPVLYAGAAMIGLAILMRVARHDAPGSSERVGLRSDLKASQ